MKKNVAEITNEKVIHILTPELTQPNGSPLSLYFEKEISKEQFIDLKNGGAYGVICENEEKLKNFVGRVFYTDVWVSKMESSLLVKINKTTKTLEGVDVSIAIFEPFNPILEKYQKMTPQKRTVVRTLLLKIKNLWSSIKKAIADKNPSFKEVEEKIEYFATAQLLKLFDIVSLDENGFIKGNNVMFSKDIVDDFQENCKSFWHQSYASGNGDFTSNHLVPMETFNFEVEKEYFLDTILEEGYCIIDFKNDKVPLIRSGDIGVVSVKGEKNYQVFMEIKFYSDNMDGTGYLYLTRHNILEERFSKLLPEMQESVKEEVLNQSNLAEEIAEYKNFLDFLFKMSCDDDADYDQYLMKNWKESHISIHRIMKNMGMVFYRQIDEDEIIPVFPFNFSKWDLEYAEEFFVSISK